MCIFSVCQQIVDSSSAEVVVVIHESSSIHTTDCCKSALVEVEFDLQYHIVEKRVVYQSVASTKSCADEISGAGIGFRVSGATFWAVGFLSNTISLFCLVVGSTSYCRIADIYHLLWPPGITWIIQTTIALENPFKLRINLLIIAHDAGCDLPFVC